jgi:hypothetical protein
MAVSGRIAKQPITIDPILGRGTTGGLTGGATGSGSGSTGSVGTGTGGSGIEIFMNQLPFKIQQGKSRTITLTGSVYGDPFSGNVTVAPNVDAGKPNTACPILQGPVTQHVNLKPGANEPIITVTFFCPANTPRGTYNCALKYSAVDDQGRPSTARGNEIDLGYNVIKPKVRPTDPDE